MTSDGSTGTITERVRFGIITLFPEMFDAVSRHGITRRAVEQGQLELAFWNPREFTHDRHRTVDDRPYGGGPGMLMKPEPLVAAVDAAKQALGQDCPVIYLSPQGRRLDQDGLKELSQQAAMILVAGRYEGVDERFISARVDQEWSIGDYVLSGGELGAMVMIDGITRLLPGTLGHPQSAQQDSFMEGLLDCPHYTRPEEFDGQRVPQLLLQGNHEVIRRWRLKQALARTAERRPDLLRAMKLNDEQQQLLQQFMQEQDCTDND